MEQRVALCTGQAGEEIAYATVGSGPVLVLAAWWTSHLELDWQNEELRDFILILAEDHTVVRYDRPGVGMSGRGERTYDLATESGYLETVIDAVGADRVDLFGISCGGPPCIDLAARRPNLINRLVFFGSYADGNRISTPSTRKAVRDLVVANWGLGSNALTSVFLPDSDAVTARRFSASQRHTTSADVAASLLQLTFDMDVSAIAPAIGQPALVIHREHDRVVELALGTELADLLPGAELRVHEGRTHHPWAENGSVVAHEVAEFLGGRAQSASVTRRLATVVFLDIVDSTSTMQAVGDQRWRDRLNSLGNAVQEEADGFGGTVVKDLGDGSLVTFEMPSDALSFAIAIRSRAGGLGLEIRTGVHTGEVEIRDADIAGRTVVVAARLCDAAGAGEIHATATVADLAAGRGFRTVDLGRKSLKGIDGDVAVLEVEPRIERRDPTIPHFERDGDHWTIGFGGSAVSVRHSKGVSDLATLVSTAGQDVDVTILMDGTAGPARSTGAAMIDETSIAAYRRRLGEIERALDAADEASDSERSAELEEEKTALLDELRAATGLGGRTRRIGDDVERARKAVSGRIRDAIDRIAEAGPALGSHLSETVSTGRTCRYR